MIGGITMFKVESKFKNANVARTIRFTEDMFEELATLAQQNGISFNNLVLQCCRYALDDMEDSSGQVKSEK